MSELGFAEEEEEEDEEGEENNKSKKAPLREGPNVPSLLVLENIAYKATGALSEIP